MKVTKRGDAPPAKIYVATCGHCDTQVEFDEYDPEAKFLHSPGGYPSRPCIITVSVVCPVCRTRITTNA